MTNTVKRHLISFAITFIASFFLTLYTGIEGVNWEAGALVGVLIASARGAFKVAWEFAMIPLLSELKEYGKKIKKKSNQ